MNHWQAPELGVPLLAMARRPARSNLNLGTISSLMKNPQSWRPVAVGSPVWIMNWGITRWKVMSLNMGRATTFLVLGSTQGFLPVARPVKFATVAGTSWSNSWAEMTPNWVLMRV